MSKLDDVLKKLNKDFGQNTIMILGDAELPEINTISTGSLMIDKILGSGIAKGRIAEIFGVESSGKSTLALQVVAQAQKNGDNVAYLDVEQAVDLNYAKKLGINVDKLIFSQPSSAEQCLEIACQLADSGEVGLIVIDSIGALAPQAELDGEMSDMTIGLIARLMSKFLRKITASLNENNCALVCINQIREAISTGFSMGPSTTTPGGRALKFFASQRVELRKTTAIKEGDQVVGNNVKIKIVKNKIIPPMQIAEVPLIFGRGFNAEDEVIDLAIDYNLIDKSGAWMTTHDGQRMQGKAKVKEYYANNPELAAELKDKVVNILKGVELEPVYEVDPETGEIVE